MKPSADHQQPTAAATQQQPSQQAPQKPSKLVVNGFAAAAAKGATKPLSPSGNDEHIRGIWEGNGNPKDAAGEKDGPAAEAKNIQAPNVAHDAPGDTWRVVGSSPPRRASMSGGVPPSPNTIMPPQLHISIGAAGNAAGKVPPSPIGIVAPPSVVPGPASVASPVGAGNGTDASSSEKDALGELGMHTQKRAPRLRAASTPNPSALESLDMNANFDGSSATGMSGKAPNAMQQQQQQQQQHSLWNQNSIWKDRNVPVSEAQTLLAMAAVSRGMVPPGLSIPVNNDSSSATMSPYSIHPQSPASAVPQTPTSARSRSKSSSAIYGLLSQQEVLNFAALASEALKDPNAQIDLNALWATAIGASSGDPSMHRRSVTSPTWSGGLPVSLSIAPSSSSGISSSAAAVAPGGPSSAVATSSIPLPSPGAVSVHPTPQVPAGQEPPTPIMAAENAERYRTQRRFSHAPALFHDWSQLPSPSAANGPPSANVNAAVAAAAVAAAAGMMDQSAFSYQLPRRHSVAGPVLYSPNESIAQTPTFLADAFDQLNLEGEHPQQVMEKIDDYFENKEQRARAWAEAGRNLHQATNGPSQWPLYVVEFKAGRTDYFYIPEGTGIACQRGDLVIVEADRGKDLGKVIHDSIQNMQQLQMFQQQHQEAILDLHPQRDIQPKKIYRLAQPQEIAMLVQKSRDEADAKEVCQRKIRHKKLPMQIVDAEFQHDRRKLTFYFVSDRRIDFRELVRDLFKLYKTRIWMCQLSPNSRAAVSQAHSSGAQPKTPTTPLTPQHPAMLSQIPPSPAGSMPSPHSAY